MAIKDILKIYPMPEQASIYTGLFAERWNDREWAQSNKAQSGVTWTKYGDAMEMSDPSTGKSLFRFFHGECIGFARYFADQNPEWEHYSLMRGVEDIPYDSTVHSYCTMKLEDRLLFADARGITDDPIEFFSDFSFSKSAYVISEPDPIIEAHRKELEDIGACEPREEFPAGSEWAYLQECADAVDKINGLSARAGDDEPEI